MDRASVRDDGRLLAAAGLMFAASAAATVAWCGSMSGGMPMSGGWTMPMAWMRMTDQTWPEAAALFLGMWAVMMVAMMTPSLVPMLLHDRRAARLWGEPRLGVRSGIVATGYFAVWTLFGAVAYPIGIALAAAEMRWPALARAVPLAAGLLLVGVGALQLTPWKIRHLAACRAAECGPSAEAARAGGVRGAWRQGLALGAHCVRCCLGLMLALLVLGVMDVGIMAWVAVAITAERLLPRPGAVARVTGVVGVAVGAWLLWKRF